MRTSEGKQDCSLVSWVDSGVKDRFEGVAIYESDDAMAISNWVLNWNHVLDAEVSVVLDDEEARRLGRQRFDAGG